MVKKVRWNKSAILAISQIAKYLEDEFSIETATRFVNNAYDKIDAVTKNPEIGRPAPNTKTVRFVLVDKNQRMYYRKNGTILHIVWFFDTRQHFSKNRF